MLKKQKTELELFRSQLNNIINLNHPLCKLADSIDWSDLHERLKHLYREDFGRPAKSVRLMVGLHYLKYMKKFSDEELVMNWVENPYWQYFCGEEYFQTEFPIHPTSMTKWRNRLGEDELQTILEGTIKTALVTKTIKPSSLQKVNVDTTVQEKNIAFPTDIRLYFSLISSLVSYGKSHQINMKQTYMRVGKKMLRRHSGYCHAKQMKRAAKLRSKMKTNLGRLYRDIQRKLPEELINDLAFQDLGELVERGLSQTRRSKNKLYSVHEPHVECISKGKAHKRYEFGCKVGFANTSKEGFILSASAFHGNPYDGHTLDKTLKIAEKNIERIGKISNVFVDLGYRKHDYTGEAEVHIVGRSRRNLSWWQKKWYNRRSVIEADIGHMKNEHRLDKNYLKGKRGDQINVVFAACGYNLRTIYRRIASIFFVLYGFAQNLPKIIRFMQNLLVQPDNSPKPVLNFA
ncbi:MAG: transposase [Smithella sp. SDB]|nr:MAG: transposase [Smithella sp. SDB]